MCDLLLISSFESAALRGTELDIEAAKGHAEQFKAISETSEQALADLQQRYHEYEASTVAEITRLQARSSYHSPLWTHR